MPEIVIRTASPGESEILVELQRRSSLSEDEYREALLAHPDAIEVPADALAAGQVRVAVQGAQIVGFATVLPQAPAVGELDGLFVEPDHMRRGIGRLLIEDAVKIARAQGVTRIDVVANPHALEFYESTAFVIDGEATTRFGPALRMHRDILAT